MAQTFAEPGEAGDVEEDHAEVDVSEETGLAIYKAFYTKITSDATMQGLLGSPMRIYRAVNTPIDPDMPYLVHRLALGEPMLHGTHAYFLDVWDYGATPARIDAAVDRLKILLHEWRFVTANDEASGLVEWFSGGDVPTDGPNVMHYATQWTIRFGAARDITNIVR